VLGPRGIDPKRRHQRVLAELDAIDHQRHQVAVSVKVVAAIF
jgi:hypothetical protein